MRARTILGPISALRSEIEASIKFMIRGDPTSNATLPSTARKRVQRESYCSLSLLTCFVPLASTVWDNTACSRDDRRRGAGTITGRACVGRLRPFSAG